MSIVKAVRRIYNETFVEPVVFSKIAKLLRDGAAIVQVRFDNRHEIRYYTGSGIRYGGGAGKRARWMMEVTRFNTDDDNIRRLTPAILPWMDQSELDLMLAWDKRNIRSIEVFKHPTKSVTDMVTTLKDIAGRLKPGMGYRFNNRDIHNDLIQPDGFMLHDGPTKYIIPEHLINTILAFPTRHLDEKFAVEQLFVQDEKKVKRQHRPVKDLKRWTVLEQLPSVENPWVIKYTHNETAGAPVFYYGLTIDIDSKAMKGYPFYITALVNSALKEVHAKHGQGVYEINDDAISIAWDATKETIDAWLAKMQRHPALLDTSPNIIYKPLCAKAKYMYREGPIAEEL